MNIDIIKESLLNLIKNADLKSFFRHFSILTWNKLGFSFYKNRLKIYETTITQDLLFQFMLLEKESNLAIELFESNLEETNGNDLEILIETEKGYIMLPCQAKIIKRGSNKYTMINHSVKNKYQIELLLEYGLKKKGAPIYLFYNFCDNIEWIYEVSKEIKFDISEYGCSFVLAENISSIISINIDGNKKAYKIPSFIDIHPKLAKPFHFMTNLIGNSQYILELFGKETYNFIKYYNRDELLEDELWHNMIPTPHIGKIEPSLTKEFIEDEIMDKFSPRFRIILSIIKKEITTKIARIG